MKDFKIYIGIGSALLLIYLIAQFNKPSPLNWTTTLKYSDKIPFGTYILYNRLTDLYPGAEIRRVNQSPYNIFQDTTLVEGNYLVIAKTARLNKDDVDAMLKFISKGSSVFISAFQWDGELVDTLKLDSRQIFSRKYIDLRFANPALKQPEFYSFDKGIAAQYFNDFDTTRAVVLGQNQEDKANFLQFKFGKGSLFLLANPQVFTNYSLLKTEGRQYAERALSYMPKATMVYWDQYQNKDIPVDESPMRVFFKHEALRWAYYLALAGLLLFVIYEIKRRQRIIPVIAPLQNSSVEFATVVGKVYYEQRDNANITAKKIVYFAEHLRSNYGLKVDFMDRGFLPVLQRKTGIEQDLATDLLNHINYLGHQQAINDHELIRLNQLIEKFYSQTGNYGK